MDTSSSDLWASFLSASKRRLASHSDTSLNCDDLDDDEDALFEFSCPFCYVEFDIGSLCSHLEDEHSCETRSVICPVCAARVGNDVVVHIMHQHGRLFKMQRRRRLKKALPSSPSNSLDPLISSLLTISDNDVSSKSNSSSEGISSKKPLSSNPDSILRESGLNGEKCELKLQEATLRVKFVQQLVLSILFNEA